MCLLFTLGWSRHLVGWPPGKGGLSGQTLVSPPRSPFQPGDNSSVILLIPVLRFHIHQYHANIIASAYWSHHKNIKQYQRCTLPGQTRASSSYGATQGPNLPSEGSNGHADARSHQTRTSFVSVKKKVSKYIQIGVLNKKCLRSPPIYNCSLDVHCTACFLVSCYHKQLVLVGNSNTMIIIIMFSNPIFHSKYHSVSPAAALPL